MRRVAAFVVLSLSLVLFSGHAGAVAQGRGTPERLAKAQLLRKVRAGMAPTFVLSATNASKLELGHLINPTEDTVRAYDPYRRVVFLSDGDPRYWESLAEPIFKMFPDKQVIKGDYEISGEHRQGNFTAMHIDNRGKLPLLSGSADLVVMRRGLCLCHGTATCGGLHVKVPELRRFFEEVYRVLDRSNAKAVAYLHGSYGDRARLKVFRQAADELMALHPEIKIEFVGDEQLFHAVRITHASQPN
jgi:hypothetical protein